MLPMRRTFHPLALLKIPRDLNKVEEGIEFLKGTEPCTYVCTYVCALYNDTRSLLCIRM